MKKKSFFVCAVLTTLLFIGYPAWGEDSTTNYYKIYGATNPNLWLEGTEAGEPDWYMLNDWEVNNSFSIYRVSADGATGRPVTIEDGTADDLLYLDAAERIGVRTNVPGYTVDVIGDRIRLRNNTSATARTLMMRADGAAVDLESLNANLFINSGVNNIIMNPWGGGVVGIGTSTPPAAAKLTVVKGGAVEATSFGNYSALFFNEGSAYFGFRNTTDNAEGIFGVGGGSGARFGLGSVTNHPVEFFAAGAVKMLLNTNGSLQMTSGAQCTSTGVWQNASSREYKKDIREMTGEDAAAALEALNPVRFRYKADKDQEEHLGFIAEDVPDLVATQDRKGMSPMDVVAVLTKVVQEQQRDAQSQQKVISELSKRVAELEKKN